MDGVVKTLKWKLDLPKKQLQNTQKSCTSTSTSNTKTNTIIDEEEEEELARLEMNLKFAQWNFEDFITEELFPSIVPHLSHTHGTLDTLSWLQSEALESRIAKIATTIANSNDKQGNTSSSSSSKIPPNELGAVQDSEVKKRVFEKTVITAKALVDEIKHEIDLDEEENEKIERRTVAFWLKENDERAGYLSDEWCKINEIKEKVVQTGVELSLVLGRLVVSLGGNNDTRVRRLFARIKRLSIGQVRDAVRGSIVISGKFSSVINFAGQGVPNRKMKGKVEEGGVFGEGVVDEFYGGVLLLDAILSTSCVPVGRNLVAGAIVRLEDMLGQVLCAMQGLKLKVGKRKSGNWKELKVEIGELWANVECIVTLEEEDEVPDFDEDMISWLFAQ